MIFPYPIKHNGVYYPAGAEVPVGKQPETKAEVKAEPILEVDKESAKIEDEPKPKKKPYKK